MDTNNNDSDEDDSNSNHNEEEESKHPPRYSGVASHNESLSAALAHRIQRMQELEQVRQHPFPTTSQEHHDALLQNELHRRQMMLLQEQRLRHMEEQQLMTSLAGSEYGYGGSSSALQDSLLRQHILQLQNEERFPPDYLLASQMASASQFSPSSQQQQQQQQQALERQLLLQQLQQEQQQQHFMPSYFSNILSPEQQLSVAASPSAPHAASLDSSYPFSAATGSPWNVPSAAATAAAAAANPWGATLPSAATTGVGSSGVHGSYKTKRLKKKETNKPKRPLSAYNIFFKEERTRILDGIPKGSGGAADDSSSKDDDETNSSPKRRKTGHGKISFENLAKVVGQRWQDLKPEQIVYYKKKASIDSERYRREMELYHQRTANLKDGDESHTSQEDAQRKPPAVD